ncbi:MAG TPA: hypothetical protein VGG49_13100 [Steroidobacteraceae bacterium]|jgi:hypothetical protein
MTPLQLSLLFAVAHTSIQASSVSGEEADTLAAMNTRAVGLVTTDAQEGHFTLTDRGRAFVTHVTSLPLPEQVTVWRIAAANFEWAQNNPAVPLATLGGFGLPRALPDDEGQPPPPAPPAKRINGIEVPSDPEGKRQLGLRLMESGFGVGEVAELLGVTSQEADGWFLGK